MKIITLYEAGSTDGYRSYGDGKFYLTLSEAEVGSSRHGGHASPLTHNKIGYIDGQYYMLERITPIAIANSIEEKEQLRQSALKKLTKAEREVLGIPT